MTLHQKQISFDQQDGYEARYFKLFNGVFLGFYTCKGSVTWEYDYEYEAEKVPYDFLINYCFNGSYEATFKNGQTQSHGHNHLSLSTSITGKGHKYSKVNGPIYEAMSLVFDFHEFDTSIKKLFEDWEVDFNQIISQLSLLKRWYSINCPDDLKELFLQIQESIKEDDLALVQIKTMESLNLISKLLIKKNKIEISSFSKNNILKVRELCYIMIKPENLSKPISDLLKSSDLSYNLFAKIFKHIYGTSPSSYRNEVIMNRAAWELKNTNKSILEISLEAGYSNPGKFSAAFKKVMELSPSKFRLLESE